MNPKNTNGRRAFTLIELLVVVTIIGILAGLVLPAIQNALITTRQTKDMNNAKQIALALMMDANDNNGMFRLGLRRDQTELSGSAKDVFQGLLNDGVVDDPQVFMGEGSTAPKTYQLAGENIGYQYVAGLTTSSPSRLPLVITKGVQIEVTGLLGDQFSPASSPWGTRGVAVAYVGGSAAFIKAKAEGNGMKLNIPLGMAPAVPTQSEAAVYK